MSIAEAQSPRDQAVDGIVVVSPGQWVGEVVSGKGVEMQETNSEIGEGDVGSDEGIAGVHSPKRRGNGTVDKLEWDGGNNAESSRRIFSHSII